jgi:hypothetical protein
MAGGWTKAAVLAVFAVAASCVPAAWGDGKAATRVTIDSAFVNPGETLFAGDIFSSRRACKNDRRVLIVRVRPGADQTIGATRSYKGSAQPGYFWTYSEPGLAPAGRYYAKVKPTASCQGDRSAAISLDR